jgi:hypothetical protein
MYQEIEKIINSLQNKILSFGEVENRTNKLSSIIREYPSCKKFILKNFGILTFIDTIILYENDPSS